MDTQVLMQNWDASAANLMQNWDASAANLMQNYSNSVQSQMMPGAAAPQAMAGPLIGGPGVEFGPGPLTAGLYQNQQPPQDCYQGPQQQQQSDGPRKGRWEMGDDGRWVDPLTGQHKITAPTKAKPRPSTVFGGAYANGGIAPGGKVSLVGERGPELIMPSGPTAVVPMGQIPTRAAPLRDTGSAMDRHMSTGLSGQPTRPVGRSMNDPQRQQEIAMRRLRSQGDYIGAARLAQSQAWLDARLGGGSAGPSPMPGPAGPSPMPMQRPALPAMPGPAGKLVPGRSAGSMVWQPDALPDVPSTPIPMPAFGTGSSAPQQPLAPLPLPPLEGNNPLTGLPLNDRPPMLPFGTVSQGMQGFPGMAPPPPGLYGEAPPLVSSIAIPGTTQMQPMIQGQPKGAPIERTKPPEAPKIPDGIQWEKDAMGKIIGGVYPTYNDQGKLVMRRIDADGNGIVTPAEQAAAMQAAMQAAGQTPGGVKFSRVQ